MNDSKTITVTLSQGWSIISGIAIAVFALTMIFSRFIAVEDSLKVIEEREIKKHNRQQEQIDAIIKERNE